MSEGTGFPGNEMPNASAFPGTTSLPDAGARRGALRQSPSESRLRGMALPLAVVMGVVADVLVRVSGRPGLNLALWAALGTGVLVMLFRLRSEPVAAESRWLVGGALAFAAGLVLRDAEALAVFSILASVALLTLAAGRAATAWVERAGVGDVAFAFLRVGLLCAAGPLGWGRGVPNPEGAAASGCWWGSPE